MSNEAPIDIISYNPMDQINYFTAQDRGGPKLKPPADDEKGEEIRVRVAQAQPEPLPRAVLVSTEQNRLPFADKNMTIAEFLIAVKNAFSSSHSGVGADSTLKTIESELKNKYILLRYGDFYYLCERKKDNVDLKFFKDYDAFQEYVKGRNLGTIPKNLAQITKTVGFIQHGKFGVITTIIAYDNSLANMRPSGGVLKKEKPLDGIPQVVQDAMKAAAFVGDALAKKEQLTKELHRFNFDFVSGTIEETPRTLSKEEKEADARARTLLGEGNALLAFGESVKAGDKFNDGLACLLFLKAGKESSDELADLEARKGAMNLDYLGNLNKVITDLSKNPAGKEQLPRAFDLLLLALDNKSLVVRENAAEMVSTHVALMPADQKLKASEIMQARFKSEGSTTQEIMLATLGKLGAKAETEYVGLKGETVEGTFSSSIMIMFSVGFEKRTVSIPLSLIMDYTRSGSAATITDLVSVDQDAANSKIVQILKSQGQVADADVSKVFTTILDLAREQRVADSFGPKQAIRDASNKAILAVENSKDAVKLQVLLDRVTEAERNGANTGALIHSYSVVRAVALGLKTEKDAVASLNREFGEPTGPVVAPVEKTPQQRYYDAVNALYDYVYAYVRKLLTAKGHPVPPERSLAIDRTSAQARVDELTILVPKLRLIGNELTKYNKLYAEYQTSAATSAQADAKAAEPLFKGKAPEVSAANVEQISYRAIYDYYLFVSKSTKSTGGTVSALSKPATKSKAEEMVAEVIRQSKVLADKGFKVPNKQQEESRTLRSDYDKAIAALVIRTAAPVEEVIVLTPEIRGEFLGLHYNKDKAGAYSYGAYIPDLAKEMAKGEETLRLYLKSFISTNFTGKKSLSQESIDASVDAAIKFINENKTQITQIAQAAKAPPVAVAPQVEEAGESKLVSADEYNKLDRNSKYVYLLNAINYCNQNNQVAGLITHINLLTQLDKDFKHNDAERTQARSVITPLLGSTNPNVVLAATTCISQLKPAAQTPREKEIARLMVLRKFREDDLLKELYLLAGKYKVSYTDKDSANDIILRIGARRFTPDERERVKELSTALATAESRLSQAKMRPIDEATLRSEKKSELEPAPTVAPPVEAAPKEVTKLSDAELLTALSTVPTLELLAELNDRLIGSRTTEARTVSHSEVLDTLIIVITKSTDETLVVRAIGAISSLSLLDADLATAKTALTSFLNDSRPAVKQAAQETLNLFAPSVEHEKELTMECVLKTVDGTFALKFSIGDNEFSHPLDVVQIAEDMQRRPGQMSESFKKTIQEARNAQSDPEIRKGFTDAFIDARTEYTVQYVRDYKEELIALADQLKKSRETAAAPIGIVIDLSKPEEELLAGLKDLATALSSKPVNPEDQKSYLEKLGLLLDSPSPDVVIAAERCLRHLDLGNPTLSKLYLLLDVPDPYVKAETMVTLASLEKLRGQIPLSTLMRDRLNDSDEIVRAGAVQSLFLLNDRDSIPAIVGKLDTEQHPYVLSQVINVVGGWEILEAEAKLKDLVERIEQSGSSNPFVLEVKAYARDTIDKLHPVMGVLPGTTIFGNPPLPSKPITKRQVLGGVVGYIPESQAVTDARNIQKAADIQAIVQGNPQYNAVQKFVEKIARETGKSKEDIYRRISEHPILLFDFYTKYSEVKRSKEQTEFFQQLFNLLLEAQGKGIPVFRMNTDELRGRLESEKIFYFKHNKTGRVSYRDHSKDTDNWTLVYGLDVDKNYGARTRAAVVMIQKLLIDYHKLGLRSRNGEFNIDHPQYAEAKRASDYVGGVEIWTTITTAKDLGMLADLALGYRAQKESVFTLPSYTDYVSAKGRAFNESLFREQIRFASQFPDLFQKLSQSTITVQSSHNKDTYKEAVVEDPIEKFADGLLGGDTLGRLGIYLALLELVSEEKTVEVPIILPELIPLPAPALIIKPAITYNIWMDRLLFKAATVDPRDKDKVESYNWFLWEYRKSKNIIYVYEKLDYAEKIKPGEYQDPIAQPIPKKPKIYAYAYLSSAFEIDGKTYVDLFKVVDGKPTYERVGAIVRTAPGEWEPEWHTTSEEEIARMTTVTKVPTVVVQYVPMEYGEEEKVVSQKAALWITPKKNR